MCFCLNSILLEDRSQGGANFGCALRVHEGKDCGARAAQRDTEQALDFESEDVLKSGNKFRPVWLMNAVLHGLTNQRPVACRQCSDRECGSLNIVDGIL